MSAKSARSRYILGGFSVALNIHHEDSSMSKLLSALMLAAFALVQMPAHAQAAKPAAPAAAAAPAASAASAAKAAEKKEAKPAEKAAPKKEKKGGC